MNREIDPQALREQVSRAEAPLPLGVRLAELDVVLPPELIPPVFEPGAEGIEEARGLWVGAGNVRPP